MLEDGRTQEMRRRGGCELAVAAKRPDPSKLGSAALAHCSTPHPKALQTQASHPSTPTPPPPRTGTLTTKKACRVGFPWHKRPASARAPWRPVGPVASPPSPSLSWILPATRLRCKGWTSVLLRPTPSLPKPRPLPASPWAFPRACFVTSILWPVTQQSFVRC